LNKSEICYLYKKNIMYILQKLSDTTKKVHTYNTVTGAFTETFDGADPIAFATETEAETVKQLINDNNDPSNHVEIASLSKIQTQAPAESVSKKKSKSDIYKEYKNGNGK